jgi:D-amino-acid oxidase
MSGKAQPALFINATGLGSKALVPDDDMYPIWGQTCLVSGLAPGIITKEDLSDPSHPVITYIIPRPGTNSSVLGGTKYAHQSTAEPDPGIRADILSRCRKLWPEGFDRHGGIEVLADQVGLRPGRKGGPRVELEVVGGKKVVHEYGHAGGGFQNSIGSARKVVELVKNAINGRAKL